MRTDSVLTAPSSVTISADDTLAVEETMLASVDERPAVQRLAASAMSLIVRRVLVMVLGVLTTAVLARSLGVGGFGAYNGALATYWLLAALGDFGFGTVISRHLGAGRANDGAAVRSLIRLQLVWFGGLALGEVGLASLVGLTTARGFVLLLLVPSVLAGVLSPVRALFYATLQTSRMAVVDVGVNACASLVLISAALLGAGPVLIGALMSASIVINAILVFVLGLGLMDSGRGSWPQAWIFLREALPLGVSSVMASAYFMLDVTIIGPIVDDRHLAHYTAAVKVLTILVTLPNLVMQAALPSVAAEAQDRERLAQLAARLCHWLAVIALPASVAVGVFAGPVVSVLFGNGFAPTAPLLRILVASSVVALLSNVLGTVMVVQRRTRWILWQNGVGVLFNVSANIVLVPHFGVAAAAWITLLTEVLVCVGSALALRRSFDIRPAFAQSRTAVLAVALAALSGLALERWPLIAIPAYTVALAVALALFRAWPAELVQRFPRRSPPHTGRHRRTA
jgi:O-antigen/teichoic acid export membrane protein